MSETPAAAANIAACFRVGNARTLVIRPLRHAELCVTHICRDYETGEGAIVIPAEDAFLIVLYLIDVRHRDIWENCPPAPLSLYPAGSICLISLRQGAAIAIEGRFEALAFHFPSAHLTELAHRAGEPRIDDLAICRGIDDQIVRDIGAALMPLLGADEARNALIAHIGLAFNAHIAHRYGRSRHMH